MNSDVRIGISEVMDMPTAPMRLDLDGLALIDNWRWLDRMSGNAACGAAVKADGYGLGAAEVVTRLLAAGCHDFFVATWPEAAEVAPLLMEGAGLSVLHGVRPQDMPAAAMLNARPVLNTAQQVARWRDAGGRACDVMIDTGMNRLGIAIEDVVAGLLDGLIIDTLMSHLVSADDDGALSVRQMTDFHVVAARVPARRLSLANSAGVCLGDGYLADLTRPGLALYGGVPRAEAADHIQQVVRPMAEVLQVRLVRAGATVGYNATWTAPRDQRVAIINLGYADGYLRAFSNRGEAKFEGVILPVIGRVSMDLTAIAVADDCGMAEGDWVELAYDLPTASAVSGLSQYELLTGLGTRYDRVWR